MARYELLPDTATPLAAAPTSGHARWTSAITPALRCSSGDEVLIATRDGLDGQIQATTDPRDLLNLDRERIHPLTGPIAIDGAEPGDALAVEILSVETDSYGFTHQRPGLGILASQFPDPFIAHWTIEDGFAASPQIPGARVAARPFLGVMGVAPSEPLERSWLSRDARLAGVPLSPEAHGLRTWPPRENGGNIDAPFLVAGSTAFFPVFQRDALFSAGDGHFVQGFGETCGAAIETRTRALLRFTILKGALQKKTASSIPWFEFPAGQTRGQPGDKVLSTLGLTGLSGSSPPDRLLEAARSALAQLVAIVSARFAIRPPAAYALCSVAADIDVLELISEPHLAVAASLPLTVFSSPDPAVSALSQ